MNGHPYYSITSSTRSKEGFRDHQRERLRGLEIDDQFDPGRLLDRKIGL